MDETSLKKSKQKSFIRWEALFPASIILGLMIAYFTLFFDSHFRKGIEFVGYNTLGAEVNVGSLETSFRRASIIIRGLQLTDSEQPTHNLFSIGEIKFDMSWDALLRGKILIEIAAIEQIQFHSLRKKPGRLKPPEPTSDEPSLIEKEGQKLAKEALEKAKTNYDDNILGDIANLLSGGSSQEQIKNLENSIKSKTLIVEIQKNFTDKQTQWNEKAKKLPQQKDLNAWNERFKKIKTNNFKSPDELQQSLKQFQDLLKEADQQVKELEKTGESFSADLKTIDGQLKNLEKVVQEDVKDLEAHFKIPKLDAKAISNSLFKRYTGPYVEKLSKYQALAHEYLPPGLLAKKSDGEEDLQIQPRPREHGISYEFGKPNSYPFFWLKKARISSKATPGEPTLGNLAGEALNITSNQALTGVPMVIKIDGDFPELKISGVGAEISINHTKRPYRELLSAKVESYPSDKKMLVSSKDIEVGFTKAVGSALIKASFEEDLIEFSIFNSFSQLDQIVMASNKEINDILGKVMSGIPNWTIEASGKGTLRDLPIQISSNLGTEIARGFEKVLNEKIAEAKAKVKGIIDEAIAKEKLKLENEINKAKNQFNTEFNNVKEVLAKQKNEIQFKIEDTKREETKKAQKQIEAEIQKRLGPDANKKLEDLKKKIKF